MTVCSHVSRPRPLCHRQKDRELWHTWQDTPNSPYYRPWHSQGGTIQGAVAIAKTESRSSFTAKTTPSGGSHSRKKGCHQAEPLAKSGRRSPNCTPDTRRQRRGFQAQDVLSCNVTWAKIGFRVSHRGSTHWAMVSHLHTSRRKASWLNWPVLSPHRMFACSPAPTHKSHPLGFPSLEWCYLPTSRDLPS